VSLPVFAWAATGMMAAIRTGLAVAMRVEDRRPAARGKLVDFALVMLTAAFVLVVVAATFAGQLANDATGRAGAAIGLGNGVAGEVLTRVIWIASATLVVAILYRTVPGRNLSRTATITAAVFTGVVFCGIVLASGVVYDHATSLSAVYGSLTIVLVFLYSVYLYACALLLGAEFAAAWSRPPADDQTPPRERLRNGVVGLFVDTPPTPDRDDPPDPPAAGSHPARADG
jgi:membrane protein